ncbi:MAG: polyisoprenoid-binding protein, partial [Burkholderiales bacterium]|nr:polyisoprenoid-binding protein [Burkholderiales bacterium]
MSTYSIKKIGISTAVALLIASPAIAAALKVDAGKSSVNIVFKQMNVPV